MTPEIAQRRARISLIDSALVNGLAQRAKLAHEIHALRVEAGETQLRDPAQEARVIERMTEKLAGFYTPDAVRAFMGALFDDVDRW